MKFVLASLILANAINTSFADGGLRKKEGSDIFTDEELQKSIDAMKVQKLSAPKPAILENVNFDMVSQKKEAITAKKSQLLSNTEELSFVPCDPLKAEEDADLGILTCGEKEYCKPLENSDLGGLCMPEEGHIYEKEGRRLSYQDYNYENYNDQYYENYGKYGSSRGYYYLEFCERLPVFQEILCTINVFFRRFLFDLRFFFFF